MEYANMVVRFLYQLVLSLTGKKPSDFLAPEEWTSLLVKADGIRGEIWEKYTAKYGSPMGKVPTLSLEDREKAKQRRRRKSGEASRIA